jgi:branched-chain amino acid transport system permease protein
MLSYAVFTLTICGIYALLALSLNLIWGGVGLVNLGLAGFFAVGAYASAIATGAGAPVLIGWGAALIVGAVVGLVVTFATLRLRDDYLAIVTLGFAEVIRLIALNERWLTKGSDGISGIRAPLKAELGLQGFNLFYLALVSTIVLLVWLLLRRLDASPYGRAMKAIREDQQLAAFAVIFLEATRFATELVPGLQPVQLAALREILVGLALILVLHLRPQGLLPERIPKAPPSPSASS